MNTAAALVTSVPSSFEIDRTLGQPVETEVVTAPASTVASRIIPGVTVDQEGVRRAVADEKAARAMGLSLKPPIYAIGTRVVEMGAENFKASRSEWDALPTVDQACAKLITQISEEARENIGIDVPSLSMNDDGTLNVEGSKYPVSRRGLDGLGLHVTPGGAGYLAECPADLRARNYNHWFSQGFRVDKRATKRVAGEDATEDELIYTPKRVTLRTRKSGEGRETFAVVGPRYGTFDIDQVAEKVMERLAGKDVRAEITYDGYKARFDILLHSNITPETAVAGEIFKVGIVVQTADDGSGAIKVSMCAWRNLCLNLIIIDFDKVLVGKRRHSGKAESIEKEVENMLVKAQESAGYFVKAWDHANTEDLIEKYDLGQPREVFRGLVLNKVVNVPGLGTDETVNKLMSAYDHEPGFTKAAFINAITRMAHTESWSSWDTMTDLESTAGELLFAKVWDCVPPKERTVAEALGGF